MYLKTYSKKCLEKLGDDEEKKGKFKKGVAAFAKEACEKFKDSDFYEGKKHFHSVMYYIVTPFG